MSHTQIVWWQPSISHLHKLYITSLFKKFEQSFQANVLGNVLKWFPQYHVSFPDCSGLLLWKRKWDLEKKNSKDLKPWPNPVYFLLPMSSWISSGFRSQNKKCNISSRLVKIALKTELTSPRSCTSKKIRRWAEFFVLGRKNSKESQTYCQKCPRT